MTVSRRGTEDADFVDIVTFDALAAICGQYMSKGRQVAVAGRLRHNEWVDGDGDAFQAPGRRRRRQVPRQPQGLIRCRQRRRRSRGGPGPAAMGRYRKAGAAG